MEYFPLSFSQKNILSLESAFPGTSVNNICATIGIEGDFDFDILQKSLHLVLEQDASMHLRLLEKEGEFFQYYAEYKKEDFPIYDFSHVKKESFKQWEKSAALQPISVYGPLYRFSLFRTGEGKGGFLIKLHHLIGDGWSTISLCNKIGTAYQKLLEGKTVTYEKGPDYSEYVKEEEKYISSKAYVRDHNYWQEAVSQGGEAAVIKSVNSAQISPVGRRMSFELPQSLNQSIYRYCTEKSVSPFIVFYMALALYLTRTGTGSRFAIGVPILNRTNFKWKQTTGMFVTTLPFYNEIKEEWTVDECSEWIKESWYDLLKHQKYPFSHIGRMAGGEDRLFHIAFSYQDGQFMDDSNPDVRFYGKWHYCGYQAEQLVIHMTSLFKDCQYAIDYDYLVQFFDEKEICRLHHNLVEIMTKALADPKQSMSEICIINREQQEQVLYDFNRTDRYLREMPVYDALVERNIHHLNRSAVICGNKRTSYRELFCKSNVLASKLHKKGVKKADLIGILLPREADLLVAMTAVIQSGGAYLVLSEELPIERIRRILDKSNAKILITNEHTSIDIEKINTEILFVGEESDSEGITEEFSYKEMLKEGSVPLSDRLAYVVYTSGSTGEPKGVEITHSNLMNLAQEMETIYSDGAVLSVCNVGFDAFMLESMVALLNGRTIVLPNQEDLESPDRLAGMIKGYRVGNLFLTPSRLTAFMRQEAFCKAARNLESIVCGGEDFPQELLRTLKKYTKAKIYNQYGPSETTVAVSFKELSHSNVITAGRPMGNCRIYILDKRMKPVPIGSFGNVYIGGSCVGRGYRNAPHLTEQSFLPSPFMEGEIIYAAGDTGYWTEEGELVLGGRKDDQVKLRGLRVELQEIRSCIESFKGVTSAFVTIRKMNGQDVLAAYYCGEESLEETQILVHVASYLPKYMVPSFALPMERFPVNANGKIDVNRLPLPQSSWGEGQELTETGKKILDVFCDVLKTEELNGESDYFLSGGNSLNAMECIIKIEEKTGFRIRIADLYACRTAVKMAAYLDSGIENQGRTLSKKKQWHKTVAGKNSYEMSPVQQGMYIQSMIDPTGLSYNMPGAFLLSQEPDFVRLKDAFLALLESEPLLRTCYAQSGEGIRGFVKENVEFELEELVAANFAEAAGLFVRPFDLGKAPLLRAALWKSEEGWYLFLDSHHIVGDGMSTPILLERLDLAYQKNQLQVRWNYYDYLSNGKLKKEEKEKQLNYWKQKLGQVPETLKLPGDVLTLSKFDYKGSDFEYEISEERSRDLGRFCEEKGISEFCLFLAAYGILLGEISGREDFVIGAPAAGRLDAESQHIMGPLINTLPLRLCPKKKNTVGQWLDFVRNTVAGMLDHQQVSLEEIITELHLPRGEQNALYQVMMTQSPVDEQGFMLDGSPMTYCPISTGCVKMDLILELSKSSKGYKLRFSYADSLLKEETIHFYARCIEQIAEELTKEENQTLDAITLLAQEDRKNYIQIPNEKKTVFDKTPVHLKLKQISSKMGAKAAVIYHGESYSYEWLEKRAGCIARFLEQEGVAPGTPVGLCLSRTPQMIAAMYGVLKAGCAYVFMLPTFPEARLSYMTEITKAGMVLYDDEAYKKMPAEYVENLTVCKACPLPDGEYGEYADRPIREDYLVNVLFTSGSTGKPKGVMLPHSSISNLYDQMERLLEPIKGRVLCSTNSVFDCFVVETIIALAMGRTVVLADEEEMMLPWKLAGLVETYHTGIFEMTPSRLQMCLGNEAFCKAAHHIGIVLLGGEVVTKALMEKFYEHSSGILMNMYGPTEATVFTTMEPLVSGEHITIGRPLQNTRTYVLDDHLRPVIPTACGELYIAGDCLAKGYISRPDLNQVSFIDDIYFPGEKMYKTGDLVRLRIDGRFDYIGRKDGQVKLNGQRVELGEITGAIVESGYALHGAVIPVRKEEGAMELCAFYEGKGEEDSETRKEGIKNHLKKVLPVYMIPSRLIELKEMPMTATNKIDMQLLKSMAVGDEEIPTEEEEANYILSVWNKVLSHPATDVNASFFELGGTSMDVLHVLSCYFNDNIEMTISQFYDNPTAAMQTELLQKTVEKKEKSFTAIGKSSLITGATGFFGIHLMKELLDEKKKVICLLRDGSETRLQEYLEWYFGKEYRKSIWDNVSVIKGDIKEKNFGMEDKAYKKLLCQVDEVYHCAADVRHYAADEESYMKTNVDGTKYALNFAKESGAAFYHMSTCSVSGDRIKDGKEQGSILFEEKDFDIGQNWEDNIYVKSKFLAEKLVMEAVREGLHAKIFRLGRLVGRAEDGRFQKNPQSNSFYLHLQGICSLGAVPQSMKDELIELTPIDTAAKEVLALREGEDLVYHIMSHVPVKMEDAVKAVKEDVEVVTDEKIPALFKEKMSEIPKEVLPFLLELQMSKKKQGTRIEVVNRVTVEQLKKLGFQPEIPGPEQLLREFRG